MTEDFMRSLLNNYKEGHLSLTEALKELKKLPYEDLGFAKIDHHRAMRNGFPEVIFCQGKTVDQVAKIFKTLAEHNKNILGTRANKEMSEKIIKEFPQAKYHEMAGIISMIHKEKYISDKKLLILTAGTADMPVAEEAAITAEVMGHRVERVYDAGVAGIHRLFNSYDKIESASVIIVVAGMEGALASVVGGLVDVPVIAVPTSVGYGAHFNGLAPLLSMLNSCATGIGVVNIDNGYGAAALADTIIRVSLKKE
ncbi:nickel pincer cofactor biosynthesis protein LarB [Candidatus Contubernalis alkaliaceticus]|uniref:nickel pincer cofactor biosynthesis protein LarB n=1 Tax=Candidatus Contubernalis alkaliaceticus TaxID=338645 RepID=UPI001F4BCE9C|nr:nickel pincer cofactor biosynthesis protein LarB [Candidatus Contubernalis alkalaceticus]UNC91363.1 nickel pincer cofactor biosynthesis protein LarB [Candidatus Contubernalis alkalaceticus]